MLLQQPRQRHVRLTSLSIFLEQKPNGHPSQVQEEVLNAGLLILEDEGDG